MKASYREIKVGFVLDLRQILLLTAAIFVPRDQKNPRMFPEFVGKESYAESSYARSRPTPKIRQNQDSWKPESANWKKGWGPVHRLRDYMASPCQKTNRGFII